MVFASVPIFLDPPNWPQQQNHHPHHEANNGNNGNIITGQEILHHQYNYQIPPLPPNPNPSHHASAGTSGGVPARSGGGSMSERARLAKIPQPEGSLKCPRCESTNTKFCYFNNYSLTQPRHFCKTCRRYWTRGGALRNVPVGGGFRRNNKKGKNGNSSKQNSNAQVSKETTSNSSGVISEGIMVNNSQFPFLATLQNLSQYGNIGLNLNGAVSNTNGNVHSSLMNDLGFIQTGGNNSDNIFPSSNLNQFALFDPASIGLYPFHGNGNIGSSSSTAPVKMEENNLLHLSRNGNGNGNNPFWVGAPDFSGINNSSSNNQIL